MKTNIKATLHAIIVVVLSAVVITFLPGEEVIEPQGDPEVISELMEELRERSDGSKYAR